MKNKIAAFLLTLAAAAAAQAVIAGTDTYFNPLTQSASVLFLPPEFDDQFPPQPTGRLFNHVNELNSPFLAPAGISQYNLTSLSEVEEDEEQSMLRTSGSFFGPTFATMIDMVAFDPSGKFLFLPHESPTGAGVSRYDIINDTSVVLFAGDGTGFDSFPGDWSNDYGAFDPARWTPNGTVIVGEEWSGEGRVIEVLNPMADPEDIEIRELHSIFNTSHEGIFFSKRWSNKVIYFIDEDDSGSLYKFVTTNKGDYTSGQTFVLVVDDYEGVPGDDFDDPGNEGAIRTGLATWVAVTDENGTPLTENDPYAGSHAFFEERNGRLAADEVGATPYGRLEDVEVGVLNGHEVLYFTATSEAVIYSVEMLGPNKAKVGVLADANTPKNLGFPATTGVLNSPDNLAQDALGNIYIIEDAPNNEAVGGDIWFARDVNNDGVAESLDHFMSIQVAGSEPTGMIFNPVNPVEFVIVVQHPDSTNLSEVIDGFGDAIWSFDLSGVAPPPCKKYMKVHRGKIRTCSNDDDYQFIRVLEWAGFKYNKPHWKH